MFKKILFSLMIFSTIAFSGCDKIKSFSQKLPACDDTAIVEMLDENLRKQILDATKSQLQFSQGGVDVGLIKEAVNHLKIHIDDISTEQKDTKDRKNLCQAKLTLGLNKTVLERAETVRKAKGELPLQDFAFRQNIELIETQIQHDLAYSTALEHEKAKVELGKSNDLQEFVAKIIVDASTQPNNTAKTATAVASTPTVVASVSMASITKPAEPTPKPSENKAIGPAGVAEKPSATVDSEEIGQAELAKIEREKAKAKAQLDFKRKEFNTLWQSASSEAQASLVEDQKQWVIDRDETCLAEAQEAEPAYQETERMRCQARLLGERYYEVKEYFDNYE